MGRTFLRLRGAVALGMVISLSFMLTTGVILWIAQQGGVVPEKLWGFASRAHPAGGMVLATLGIVHLALNKQLFVSDLFVLFGKKKK